MNDTVKRYLWSSLITFSSTFLAVFAATLPSLEFENLTFGAVAALLVVAFRTAVKVLVESLQGRLQ